MLSLFSAFCLSFFFFPLLVKTMQTQRSNYGRKPTSISIWQWSKRPWPPCLGMQTATELQEAGEGDKGQQKPASILRLMVLTGLKNMILKMNFMTFLLFINSRRERGRRRRQAGVCDYWLQCWKYNELDTRIEFPSYIWWPTLSYPDCHNCVSVSPGVSVFRKGTFVVSVLLCQEVKRIAPPLPNASPPPPPHFKQSQARGIHLSWFGFVS